MPYYIQCMIRLHCTHGSNRKGILVKNYIFILVSVLFGVQCLEGWCRGLVRSQPDHKEVLPIDLCWACPWILLQEIQYGWCRIYGDLFGLLCPCDLLSMAQYIYTVGVVVYKTDGWCCWDQQSHPIDAWFVQKNSILTSLVAMHLFQSLQLQSKRTMILRRVLYMIIISIKKDIHICWHLLLLLT